MTKSPGDGVSAEPGYAVRVTVSWVKVLLVAACAFGAAVAGYNHYAACDLAVALRLGVIAGMVGLGVLAARWHERGPSIVAASFAPVLLSAFGSARRELDAIVVGMGDWCGTGQAVAAVAIFAVSIPLTIGVALAVMRYGLPHRGVAAPWLTGVLALLCLVAIGVGAERVATRPSLAAFKEGFGPAERAEYGVDPLTRPSRELLRSGPLALALDCSIAERPCRTTVDLNDGVGVRKLRYDELVHGEAVLVEPHASGRVWRLTLEGQRGVREHYPPVGLVIGRAGSPTELSVADLPGMIAPPWQVVALALPGLFALLAATGWILRGRQHLARLATGREAELDAQGFLELEGERVRVEAPSIVPPAPVIVMDGAHGSRALDYRSVPMVGGRAVIFGHVAAHQHRFDELVRRWRPLIVIASLLSVMPLLAALHLG